MWIDFKYLLNIIIKLCFHPAWNLLEGEMILPEGDWEKIACVIMGLFEKCTVLYLFFNLGHSADASWDLGLWKKKIMWRLEANARPNLLWAYLKNARIFSCRLPCRISVRLRQTGAYVVIQSGGSSCAEWVLGALCSLIGPVISTQTQEYLGVKPIKINFFSVICGGDSL